MLTPSPAAPLARPVPAARELPPVRAGNVPDAKALRTRLQTLLQGLERADEVLFRLVAQAQVNRIYLVLEDPRGRFFKDWTSFCTAPRPWGLGISQALVDELAREQRDPRRRARLTLEGPLLLQTRSAPRKGRAPASVTRGMEYSLQRLLRDRPDLLQRVASGELPSLQAAAELAGHRPPFSAVLVEPESLARLIVSRLEPAQQAEVIRLVQHPQEIPDPGHGRNPHWERYKARTVPAEVLAQQRAQAKAERRAHRQAYEAAYNARRTAARRAQRGPQQPPPAPATPKRP